MPFPIISLRSLNYSRYMRLRTARGGSLSCEIDGSHVVVSEFE